MSAAREKPARQARAQLFLEEMGLGPVWISRSGRGQAAVAAGEAPRPDYPAPAQPTAAAAGADDAAELLGAADDHYAAQAIMEMDWASLKDTVSGCVKCGLCKDRTKTVFGAGDEKAAWLFIGEGPGRNEDLQGEPFVGQAGKLLDNMLLELGVSRGRNAYIANVVKCRPTDSTGRDRPPTPQEAGACLPYLQRQIEMIKPTVLVALGKTAAISLLGLDANTPVGTLRGKVHRYRGLPLIVTYHPAYLLRKLTEKGKVWTDLCLASSVQAGDAERPAE